MFRRSYSLGQTILKRANATAANPAHMDPTTMARAVIDIARLDRRVDENQRHVDGRLDANIKHVDDKLGANVKLVDDKLDSAFERFLKSVDSLKTEMKNVSKEIHKLDKSVTTMKQFAVLFGSSGSLLILYKSGAFSYLYELL